MIPSILQYVPNLQVGWLRGDRPFAEAHFKKNAGECFRGQKLLREYIKIVVISQVFDFELLSFFIFPSVNDKWMFFSECFKKGQNGITQQGLAPAATSLLCIIWVFLRRWCSEPERAKSTKQISRGSIAACKSSAQIGVSSLQIYSNSM